MLKIEPLSPVAGARVEGVDLSRPLDGSEFSQIEKALHEHCFVVFAHQTLSAEQFVAFSRRWGRPEPHVIDTFHHPVDANILILSNVSRNEKPIGLLDAGAYFHTDYSYLDVPARCTILHAIQVPRERNGTTFANQTRAYADLTDAMKARIDGLVARHRYGNRDDLDESSRTVASVLSESQKQKVDWVRHRLARPHPRTGVKSLYAVSGSSFGIEDMEHVQALALLDELKAHATQEKYRQVHDYTVGDVIVWDNAQLLHAAPLTHLSDPRTLWRITVKEEG
ncbi:MAG: TauD/TfdA family dioxygenase [Ramlibacter sp.]